MPDALSVATEAASAAGAIHQERFRTGVDIARKGENDIVTAVDREAETAIVDRLADAFPAHAILAEESGSRGESSHRWLVDPLDGTTNFARGIPHYSVSIALEIHGRLDLGVVYYPPLDDIYTAIRGEGARCNGSPISPSDTDTVGDALVALEYSPEDLSGDGVLEAIRTINRRARRTRHLGSSASELAMVASGGLDAFFGTRLRPWDAAAGHLLVEEVGGTITRVEGAGGTARYVASNGAIHQVLLDAVRHGRGG